MLSLELYTAQKTGQVSFKGILRYDIFTPPPTTGRSRSNNNRSIFIKIYRPVLYITPHCTVQTTSIY